jgi:hypothetical protein
METNAVFRMNVVLRRRIVTPSQDPHQAPQTSKTSSGQPFGPPLASISACTSGCYLHDVKPLMFPRFCPVIPPVFWGFCPVLTSRAGFRPRALRRRKEGRGMQVPSRDPTVVTVMNPHRIPPQRYVSRCLPRPVSGHPYLPAAFRIFSPSVTAGTSRHTIKGLSQSYEFLPALRT